jgi:hypothetical protein
MNTQIGSAFVLAGMIHASASAGAVVTQNVVPGAMNWPGSPSIQTVTNPAGQVAGSEGFNAVGGCANSCEAFVIATTNPSRFHHSHASSI